jgi:hypothetical protein
MKVLHKRKKLEICNTHLTNKFLVNFRVYMTLFLKEHKADTHEHTRTPYAQ